MVFGAIRPNGADDPVETVAARDSVLNDLFAALSSGTRKCNDRSRTGVTSDESGLHILDGRLTLFQRFEFELHHGGVDFIRRQGYLQSRVVDQNCRFTVLVGESDQQRAGTWKDSPIGRWIVDREPTGSVLEGQVAR